MAPQNGWVTRKVNSGCKFRKKLGTLTGFSEEIYLREDISCGCTVCDSCTRPKFPVSPSTFSIATSHYLVPDVDTLASFVEIFEIEAISNVILLASVIKQISSARVQARLKRVLLRTGRCHFLDDIHSLSLHMAAVEHNHPPNAGIDRKSDVPPPDESSFPYSVRSLLPSAHWLAYHLQGSAAVVVLSSHLPPDPERSESMVAVVSAEEYFGNCNDEEVKMLYQSLDQKSKEDKEGDGNKNIFRSHWSANKAESAVSVGTAVRGKMRITTRGGLQAFVTVSSRQLADEWNSQDGGSGDGTEVRIVSRNRAIHGDTVVVKILPRDQWVKVDTSGEVGDTAKKVDGGGDGGGEYDDALVGEEAVNAEEGGVEVEDEDAEDVEVIAKPKPAGSGVVLQPTAEVVRVWHRPRMDYVVCLAEAEESDLLGSHSGQEGSGESAGAMQKFQRMLCIPADRRIPKIRIATRQGLNLVGCRFVVRIDDWPINSQYPDGHLVRVIGPIGDLTAERAAILIQNDIPTEPFSKLALTDLPIDSPEHPWSIPTSEERIRRDLRRDGTRIASIDPPGCVDVDDALSVRRIDQSDAGGGGDSGARWEVGVHIADVSWFVRQNSALDVEARMRGTTVYLIDQRLDMLPPVLSENLCSLHSGVDRLAVSVIWTLDQNMQQISPPWFGRTIIHSNHKMAYAQAQAILDGAPQPENTQNPIDDWEEQLKVRSDLEILNRFAGERRRRREAAGAVELGGQGEFHFLTSKGTPGQDDEGGAAVGSPSDVSLKEEVPMMKVVAELMIAANAAVGHRIISEYPTGALLRRHPPPKPDAFEELKVLLNSVLAHPDNKQEISQGSAEDYRVLRECECSDGRGLAAVLSAAERVCPSPVLALVKMVATRAMSEAEYFSTGEVLFHGAGTHHFGLGLEFYTHFTSPIRRYADVMVHRMLLSACSKSRPTAVHGEAAIANTDVASSEEDTSAATRSISGPDSLRHDEVASIAVGLNDRNRASKRAQKDCSDMYLRLLLQKAPRVEQGWVIGIKDNGLLVFLPGLQLKVNVILHKKGEDSAWLPAGYGTSILDHPLELVISSGGTELQCRSFFAALCETHTMASFKLLQKVWVLVGVSEGGRIRAPSLTVDLLHQSDGRVQSQLARNTDVAPISGMKKSAQAQLAADLAIGPSGCTRSKELPGFLSSNKTKALSIETNTQENEQTLHEFVEFFKESKFLDELDCEDECSLKDVSFGGMTVDCPLGSNPTVLIGQAPETIARPSMRDISQRVQWIRQQAKRSNMLAREKRRKPSTSWVGY